MFPQLKDLEALGGQGLSVVTDNTTVYTNAIGAYGKQALARYGDNIEKCFNQGMWAENFSVHSFTLKE